MIFSNAGECICEVSYLSCSKWKTFKNIKNILMKSTLFPILFTIFLFSCKANKTNQQLYYATNIVTPAVTEQDMISANVSAGFSDGMERSLWGMNADVAYSPVKNLGIAAGYSFSKNSSSAPYAFNNGEIMGGYYLPFDPNNKWFVSVYGGGKFGKMSANNYYDSINNFRAKVTADFNDFFLQPSFLYRAHNLSMQTGLRVTWRNYSKVKHYYNTYDEFIPGTYYFVQPFFDMAFGSEQYKVFFKYSVSSSPKGASLLGGDRDLFVRLFWPKISSSVSVGVRMDFKNVFQVDNRVMR